MWSLRLSTVICIALGLRSLGVTWAVLADLDLYRRLDVAGPWFVRVTLHTAWSAWFLHLAWRLRRWQPAARQQLWPSWALYAAFSWGWLALFAQTAFDRQRLAFLAVTFLLLLGLGAGLQWRVRRAYDRINEADSTIT